MAEDKFTAIIVGAGPAGSTAAYLLAEQGIDVLLIERGETPGCKNMFGGRMYSYALHRIIPEFWEEAPLERQISREVITMLDGEKSTSISCQDENWAKPPYHSFTLLRAEFDAWLAAKAEDAGAILACGIRVDDVIMEDNRIIGIRAGDDEILADVVIAADGANSIITEKAGLRSKLSPADLATGVKEVIELPAKTIEERFNLQPDTGAAHLYAGTCTQGMSGGGFLYTNKSSISLGLVIKAAELQKNQYMLVDLIEDFKNQPSIAPLISGGEVVEYSAHLVPEAGISMAPRLFSDGILVTGDAAGFCINLGYLVRGMDLAIASGEAAAMSVVEAVKKNDFSAASLGIYTDLLVKNGVWSVMEAYRRAPQMLDTERLYTSYPTLLNNLLADMFTIDGSPPINLIDKLRQEVKNSKTSFINLAGDAWKGGRSL
ncbi:MAG: FAD-dependent oxidoreductase [Syntrophomonadaceae bacterium]|nr:FAD-dependent oxidoreductase [Syntrophomonadaceae bacterium]MDD3889636.1 FAD-dependent oxidoreductase [Syntrophomonadaceae bacterium]MDD4549044.1 FAD-dependent oxidoreductase [Syntrophomonadaceae bacterium]